MNKIKRGLLASLLLVGLCLGVGVAGTGTAGAQGCSWYQVVWVLNAHGSTQYLADTCYNNHFAAYDYPQGGGSPVLAFEVWAPLECIQGGVSVAAGNNAGAPSKMYFEGVSGSTFCQFDVWGWMTTQGFKAGSCNGWNVRTEGWVGSTYGNVWYGGTKGSSPNYCSGAKPKAVLFNYGI